MSENTIASPIPINQAASTSIALQILVRYPLEGFVLEPFFLDRKLRSKY